VLIVGKRSKLRRRRRQSDDSDVEDDDYLIEDDEERRTHIQARRDRQREEQWQRMATHDVTTAFRAVREQFKQRFTREHCKGADVGWRGKGKRGLVRLWLCTALCPLSHAAPSPHTATDHPVVSFVSPFPCLVLCGRREWRLRADRRRARVPQRCLRWPMCP
jgi:hypothetical protein